ncbi:MarR family winged helix-turn-helix transcriptional regulator [Brucepastera parasyntrophica]|uniref:MarR family winged helix-turn-helix transcriptional regulator n=1 Tax=Brucepastera parasyntrophica TaxID=2880008 RepID=UPI00210ABF04|nr:helix-turn-helix domain-containing protein [Brucepastera parasyntrophica]ULQ59978.1 MarR family winged helix-turn-helix transcriptional regulator [Brucepastera parasyntrophica]
MDSGYSLAEARIIFEISRTEHCTANQLCSLLDMDRSYMSRIISKLEKRGLILRSASNSDGRSIEIRLSDSGIGLYQQLSERSNGQVEKMLQTLHDADCEKVIAAMNTVKKYLTIAAADLRIRPYEEADIEYVIDRQLSLYETERHFTSEIWKKYITQGVLSFVNTFRSEKDCMFILECNGKRAGCVAIKNTKKNAAQLRYFFWSLN